MTIYGFDLSHYDSPDSRAAVAEGFSFFTHKAGGDRDDAEIAAWWGYMKPFRDRVLLGAYWVLYPGNPVSRADAFLARLDSQCPGWRDGPFILQVDCEMWNGNPATKPGLWDIRAFCGRLRSKMPKLMPIVYAPEWAYGDSLIGLGYPLWASSYVSGAGYASKLYPGDTSGRWGAYSGQVPKILQFTSSAIIAGQTTCDANAFRGTLDELTALLAPGWEDDMTKADFIAWLKDGDVQDALVRAIFYKDGVLAAPPGAVNPDGSPNPQWTASSYLTGTYTLAGRIRDQLTAVSGQVGQVDDELFAKLADPSTPDEQVAAAVVNLLGPRASTVLPLMQSYVA